MPIYLVTFLFMYVSKLLVFTLSLKHFLLMLLSLESCLVALYIGLFFY